MASSSLLAQLSEARKTFQQYVENEENSVKQNKLREFIPYIDKAFDMREMQWYLKKAVEEADAKQAFLDYKKLLEEMRQAKIARWKKILPFFWGALVVASFFVIKGGFEPRYVYIAPSGFEVSSDIYSGAKMLIKEEAITLKYSHTKQSFVNHPTIRVIIVAVGVIAMMLLTALKLEYI